MREIYPPVTFRETDYTLLSNLVLSHNGALSEVRSFLEHELDRGMIVPDDRFPANIVGMGSTVTYKDLGSGRERTITLVAPDKSDINRNSVSIVTPVGAALIGLAEGQVIAWETWAGTERMLMVLKVHARQPQ
jgi:regulator of nucleoside diphosphate kinase